MRILFFTPNFYPKMGGLEVVADLIAKGLSEKADLEVRLFTLTELGKYKELEVPYKIIRTSNFKELWKAIKWCDVFVHHGLSLKAIFPLLFYRRKWFVIHHLPYLEADKKNHIFQYLKQYLTRFCQNISVSNYVRNTINDRGIVIYNPYNRDLFKSDDSVSKRQDLLFVGRLVSDKGVELLLTSICILKKRGIGVKLSIVGDGAEKTKALDIINKHELTQHVILLGEQSQENTAKLMMGHKILVIPSIWEEPFGIIALEGLACGCQVIASNAGGLPEALEGYGEVFEKNNVLDLADKLAKLLAVNRDLQQVRLTEKLKKHDVSFVAEQYLSYFNGTK